MLTGSLCWLMQHLGQPVLAHAAFRTQADLEASLHDTVSSRTARVAGETVLNSRLTAVSRARCGGECLQSCSLRSRSRAL